MGKHWATTTINTVGTTPPKSESNLLHKAYQDPPEAETGDQLPTGSTMILRPNRISGKALRANAMLSFSV